MHQAFLRSCVVLVPVIASLALPLSGCATPEELAVQQQRRERSLQTGSNIARTDGRGGAGAVTDRDAQDTMLNEMRNNSRQSLYPQPSTQ